MRTPAILLPLVARREAFCLPGKFGLYWERLTLDHGK